MELHPYIIDLVDTRPVDRVYPPLEQCLFSSNVYNVIRLVLCD